MIDYVEYLNLPVKAAIVLVIFFLLLQVVGEILEVKGKAVPEFAKVRKYFARKKMEREAIAELKTTLEAVKKQLSDIHDWRKEFDQKLDINHATTMSILIENKRSEIIGFASYVIDTENPVTREQFNRIFKMYDDYETILKENHLTNGEAKIAMRIIRESYETHMREHSFVEDVRGYEHNF